MFSFFRKKDDAAVKVSGNVLITKEAKWHALASLAISQPNTVFIAWFNDTEEQLQSYFQQHNVKAEVVSYRQAHGAITSGKKPVFVEHYPLRHKEQEVFASLGEKTATVYASLDEPLFRHFGGEKIVTMMKTMGVADNEVVNHVLVSKAIQGAQEKLAKKVVIEHTANSQEEWMQKNVPAQ